MTKPPARYLVSFAVTLIVIAVLYTGLFVYQLGAPVEAEYWVYDVKIAKLFLGGRAEGERVVILGGSSALFGIDSGLIERETGMRTVNLAVHAGLSLPYLFEDAKPILRPRDIVIVPLELEYYARDYSDSPNVWFLNNIMAWDPGYFWKLGLLEKARFILAVSAKRVVNGAVARMYEATLRRTHGRLVRDPAAVTREARGFWEAKAYLGAPAVYSLRNLDERGDMQNNRGTHYTGPWGSLLELPFAYSSKIWGDLESLAAYCRRHDIALFVAWPAITKGPTLDSGNPFVQRNSEEIVRHLEKAGIGALGRPRDYLLDRVYFFDSEYHLNEEGRAIHTQQLLRDLREALGKGR